MAPQGWRRHIGPAQGNLLSVCMLLLQATACAINLVAKTDDMPDAGD